MGRDPARIVVAVLFALTAAVFLTSLPAYLDVWSAQPYTHGYLIAIATVWLVWRERDAFRSAAARVWMPGVLAALAVSLMWLVATVADARAVVLALVPAVLLLWSAAAFGKRTAQRLAPLAGIFLLAVPLWEGLNTPLQHMTIAVTGVAERLFHIPATIEGNLVHIAYGTFAIEGGCSGLNYFMSGLTVGALYACIFLRRWPARLAAVALAGLLAIVGNWVRVSTVIAIGHITEMQAAIVTQSLPHIAYGWGIFLLSVVAFFVLVRPIERWELSRWPSAPAGTHGAGAGHDRTAAKPAAWATLAALAGPLLYVAIGALPERDPDPFTAEAAASWHQEEGTPERPFTWQPAFAGAQEHVQHAWGNGGTSVFSDRLVYRRQSQGEELIGYRSRIAPDSLVAARRLFGPVGTKRRLVNEAIVRDGDDYVLVWYWYRVGGVEAVEPLRAKLLEVWAFLSRQKVSELIAFSAACAPDSCTDAFRTLSSFFGRG